MIFKDEDNPHLYFFTKFITYNYSTLKFRLIIYSKNEYLFIKEDFLKCLEKKLKWRKKKERNY